MKQVRIHLIVGLSILMTACGSEEKTSEQADVSPMVKEFANLDCERIQISTNVRKNPDDDELKLEEKEINERYLQRANELKEELGNDDFNQLMLDAREYNDKNCKY